MSGWIKLYRSIRDWEWYDDVPVRLTFFHCLVEANFKERQHRGETITRGSFPCGREQLAKDIGVSIQQLRTSLNKLKKTGELCIKSTSRGMVITVCNYDDYQLCDDVDQPAINQQSTSNQPAINHSIRKKERKKERNTVAETQKVFWSSADGFKNISDEQKVEWSAAYPACNLEQQLLQMHQWLKTNPAKARKKNWERFITNWMSRQQEQGGDFKTKPQQSITYRI